MSGRYAKSKKRPAGTRSEGKDRGERACRGHEHARDGGGCTGRPSILAMHQDQIIVTVVNSVAAVTHMLSGIDLRRRPNQPATPKSLAAPTIRESAAQRTDRVFQAGHAGSIPVIRSHVSSLVMMQFERSKVTLPRD